MPHSSPLYWVDHNATEFATVRRFGATQLSPSKVKTFWKCKSRQINKLNTFVSSKQRVESIGSGIVEIESLRSALLILGEISKISQSQLLLYSALANDPNPEITTPIDSTWLRMTKSFTQKSFKTNSYLEIFLGSKFRLACYRPGEARCIRPDRTRRADSNAAFVELEKWILRRTKWV